MSVSLADSGKSKFARMQILNEVNGDALTAFSKKRIVPGSEIRTDGLNIYKKLAKDDANDAIKELQERAEFLLWKYEHSVDSYIRKLLEMK